MQRLLIRAPPPISDSNDESNDESNDADEAAAQQQQRWRQCYTSQGSRFADSRNAMFARQVNLYTFDTDAARRAAYVETKIGGHPLDHRRIIHSYAQSTRQSLSTAVWIAAARLISSRSSLAFDITRHDVLDYAATKIGGHPLDHVPFIDRGQPSRPLLGFTPSRALVPRTLASHSAPALFGRDPSQMYGCSRCLRTRQSPRVQLSCGHPVCASCVASKAMQHAETGAFCFLECTQCHTLVTIEAIVFSSNYKVRIHAPAVPTLAEFVERNSSAQLHAAKVSASAGWKYGGIVAVLAVAAKSLYRSRRPRVSTASPVVNDRKHDATVSSAANAATLLDDVAALGTRCVTDIVTTDETIASGAARWQKRITAVQAPSQLLKFEFVRTLGVGNFAEVMLVQRKQRSASNAPQLQLSVLKESDKLRAAVNEIRILSQLRSPHVVRVFSYFVEAIGHRDCAYIEMEFCDRGDLAQLLQRQGPLEAATFDALFRQLCFGLQAIHTHGIVHRDLKPGNVLLTSDGVTKIADFGVSTWLESDLLTHHVAGTVAFMAPEVRRYFLGEAVSYDATADIWSLGALAVAMLTGDPEPRVATRPLDELLDELRDKGVSSNHITLLERTLHADPTLRATLSELLALVPAAITAKL